MKATHSVGTEQGGWGDHFGRSVTSYIELLYSLYNKSRPMAEMTDSCSQRVLDCEGYVCGPCFISKNVVSSQLCFPRLL